MKSLLNSSFATPKQEVSQVQKFELPLFEASVEENVQAQHFFQPDRSFSQQLPNLNQQSTDFSAFTVTQTAQQKSACEMVEDTLATPAEAEQPIISDTLQRMLQTYEKTALYENEAEKIKQEAQAQAQEILKKAKDHAQIIEQTAKEQGLAQGLAQGIEKGYQEGLQQAQQECQENLQKEAQTLLETLKTEIEQMQAKRQHIFTQQIADMRDLSLAIAEKIIHVNLAFDKYVVEQMIFNATQNIRNEQKAKIYLSALDVSTCVNADEKILGSLKSVSKNIKFEILENRPSGTCIIELEDQIIDASVDAQLEQAKILLESKRITDADSTDDAIH